MRKFTDDHRKKLSEAARNRKHSNETRKKISNSLKGNTNGKGNLGNSLTEDHRSKISSSMKRGANNG